jgi:hypothetical protein
LKSFPAEQLPLIERPDAAPVYFAHIYLPSETLYFSDRDFTFNGHRYESYLLNIPETAESIERFGGYLNISAQLTFRNLRFRSYAKLFDFFLATPIVKREMDLYVLYLKDGVIPGSDVSTLLHKLSFGEFKRKQAETFDVTLFSVLFALDQRKLFPQINRNSWPMAAPADIGKFENRCVGSIRDVPCHCVETGAVSTLAADVAANAGTIYLTEVDYPVAFPSSGTIQLGIGTITYTGKNSSLKCLTGCTWSFPARNQKRGEPVWEIKSTYKYLVDAGVVKAVTNVKAAGVKIPDASRTITLNDNGKTTISFTQRALLKNQGAHSHSGALIEKYYPTGSAFSASPGMGASGFAAYLKDGDLSSFCHVGVTGSTGGALIANFDATFPVYAGATPDRVYACIVCDDDVGFLCGEYFALTLPQGLYIGTAGYAQGKFTWRGLLTGTSVPTTLRVTAYTGQGTPVNPCKIIANVYEMWLELEFDSMPSGGENAVWSALVPQVTADVEGYPDTSGDYTGVANALIQGPADVLKYLLVGILGRSLSEMDASFGTVRTTMAARISGGYKLAALLSKLGNSPMEIVKAIQEQSRCRLREDGGKFKLSFDPMPTYSKSVLDSLPTNGVGITASAEIVGYEDHKSCDDNAGTYWSTGTVALPQWVQVDWEAVGGAGTKKIIYGLNIQTIFSGHAYVKDFTLYGSPDGVSWDPIFSGRHGDNASAETFLIRSISAYRYHRLTVTSNWLGTPGTGVVEWQLFAMTQTATAETSVMDIDSNIFIGDPVFTMSPAKDIKNLLRAVYGLDYSINGASRKFGDYLNQIEANDSQSIGDNGELPEDITLSGISNADMAEDIIWWHLWGQKDSAWMVDMVCNRRVKKLERGDCFTLYDTGTAAWEGSLWMILEKERVPNRQEYRIGAVKYLGP